MWRLDGRRRGRGELFFKKVKFHHFPEQLSMGLTLGADAPQLPSVARRREGFFGVTDRAACFPHVESHVSTCTSHCGRGTFLSLGPGQQATLETKK